MRSCVEILKDITLKLAVRINWKKGMFCGGSKSAKGGPNPLADMDRGSPNPLADLDRGVQIRGGSKSAVTPD